jgi:hypothetical protein
VAISKKYRSDDSRLCSVADTARQVMQFFREERLRAVRLFAGNRYSSNAYLKKTYVNLISLYINIVSRSLISKNPRVMLSTFDPEQRAPVSAAEAWMNMELVRQDFASNMQRMVVDGLFSLGIAKVCIATPGDAANSGWNLQAGRPCLDRVDLDDYVFDHRARDFVGMSFEGHRYRMPYEIAMDNPHFNRKAKDNLEKSFQIAYNRQGDERVGEIGRDFPGYDEDLYDMVDLWEFYLPQEKMVKTFTESDMSGPTSSWEGGRPVALEEKPWTGPDCGPYIKLGYQIVPGNIYPKGPVLDLMDLHELANEGYRKLGRQFGKLKKLTVFQRDSPEDGQAIMNAKDGDGVPLNDPKSVQDIMTGGGDAGLFNFVRENISRFMEQAGNLMTMGGLAAEAQTLGQEELLQQQSNGQISAMQDTTTTFVSKVCDSMLWYFWNDPTHIMQVPLNDPQLPDVKYVRTVHPWAHDNPHDLRRRGPKPEIKIDPYSMRHTTPQQRVKDITGIITGLYTPLAQMFQQQGIVLDLNELLAIMGKNMDLPELQSIIKSSAPPPPQGSGGDSAPDQGPTGPTQPPAETVHTRRSIGGGSRQAKAMQMDNHLAAQMGGQNGKQEFK